MKTEDIYVVLCTFPDLEKARQIATAIIESQLAACVNLIPQVESIYHWEGKIQNETEVIGVFKTRELLLERLEAKIRELHPYDVPEFLALPVDFGGNDYFKWIRNETIHKPWGNPNL